MIDLKSNQRGITLVVLIITIIVMLILVGVTVEIGTGSIDNSRMLSFTAYMQIIQTKTDFIAENDDYTKYGEPLTSEQKGILQDILDNENENFLTTEDSTYLRYFDSNKIKSDLETENIKDEVIIDFNTREVISLNGVKYKNKMYYTQYYLPGGQSLKQPTENINRTATIGNVEASIDGLNATFTIKNIGITNGTLSYGKEYVDENNQTKIKWTVITNYTTKGENVTTRNITESGIYYFKIVDNVSKKDNADSEGNYPLVELRLTNAPKLQGNLTDLSPAYNYSNIKKSEEWAFATDKTNTSNLVYYVWLPRFAYKLDEANKLKELQFLRGTSNVGTNGEYIDSTKWIIPTVFTNAKTGVWVKVTTPNQARHRYN